MSIKVKEYQDIPAVVITIEAPLNVEEDSDTGVEAIIAYKRQRAGQNVYGIWDVSDADLDFGKLVQVLGKFPSLPPEYWENMHPVTVGTEALAGKLAEYAGQEQYGSHDVTFFYSVDEALRAVRAEVQEAR